MNITQAIEYEKAVLASAKEWTNGETDIGNQRELYIIAAYYRVNLPACMYHFQYSNSPNHVCATGAHKTIMKTLDKLAAAIRKAENIA